MLTKANFVIVSLSPHFTYILQPLGERVTGSLELFFTDKNGISYWIVWKCPKNSDKQYSCERFPNNWNLRFYRCWIYGNSKQGNIIAILKTLVSRFCVTSNYPRRDYPVCFSSSDRPAERLYFLAFFLSGRMKTSRTAIPLLTRLAVWNFYENLLSHLNFHLDLISLMTTLQEDLRVFLQVSQAKLAKYLSERKIFRANALDRN
jgi:hypothetical protein